MVDVVIVGAGVAGLVCAIELSRAGRSVTVVECEDAVGGRVRTSVREGCTIDHGFQVLFTAYPVLRSYLDFPSLDLRAFRPAAHVVTSTAASHVGDALRDPSLLLDTISPGIIPLVDKLRLLALRHAVRQLSVDECFAVQYTSISARELLMQRGFHAATIEGFFAPFYGGILLDRSLSAHAGVLLFTFKMLSEGSTVVPARGMGAIPEQLATHLPADCVRTGTRVVRVNTDEGRATGVLLSDGTRVDARHVVLAADAPGAAALVHTTGEALQAPASGLGSTTLYFSAPTAPLPGRSLWLNASPDAVISHAITLSEVVPEYAPGQALLAATAVGRAADESDDVLIAGAYRELATMCVVAGLSPLPRLTPVAIYRVPYSQFAQPPGRRIPDVAISPAVSGLWRASEVLHSSSLEGAARGGRDAARAVIAAHNRP